MSLAPLETLEPTAEQSSQPVESDMEHLVCEVCHPAEDIALCGAPVTNDVTCTDWLCGHLQCVVCDDLERTHPCL